MGTWKLSDQRQTPTPYEMKIVIAITSIFALSMGAPTGENSEGDALANLMQDVRTQEGAAYSTMFEIDNGIATIETGSPGVAGQTNVQGSYSWRSPDGSVVMLTLVADESGSSFSSPSGHLPEAPLPVAAIHPIPAHALEQIAFAQAQREAGLTYDGLQDAWV